MLHLRLQTQPKEGYAYLSAAQEADYAEYYQTNALECDFDFESIFKPAEEGFPSFLLAASVGNPGMIKVFLDSNQRRFNPLIKDNFGNTALHYALKRRPVFQPHLVDFVSCQHVLNWRKKSRYDLPKHAGDESKDVDIAKKSESEEAYGQKKGCIILLLQAGLDVWAENCEGKVASPEPDAPDDFVTWWYEKVAQETEKVQVNLNAAANAISVTAALVATASYLGPLQPPLSYGGDPSSVQVKIASVRIFIVCNNISFYLALVAIMLALLPSLPRPQQSVFKVLSRTRTHVALAASSLFPSIICVLIAFAAGSIAVVPDHGLLYHGLTMATTVVCGLISLIVICWFANGLWNVLETLPLISDTVLTSKNISTKCKLYCVGKYRECSQYCGVKFSNYTLYCAGKYYMACSRYCGGEFILFKKTSQMLPEFGPPNADPSADLEIK